MKDVIPSQKVVDVNFNMYTKICLPHKFKEGDLFQCFTPQALHIRI